MIKARIRWCSCRVENILTLGKLLRLWFCFLLHSIFFYISSLLSTYKIISSYELTRPIMGTILLVYYWASEASPTLGCSIEISRDVTGSGKRDIFAQTMIFQYKRCCSKKRYYWATEASPTLGCSIEISRDIYIFIT